MKKNIPVLIVGAGTSGLALALWLRKKGISIRIIDKNNGPTETSRALAIQGHTLEFYKQLEVVDEIISAGIFVPELIFSHKNKNHTHMPLKELGISTSPYPNLFFLSQGLHEKILIKKLAQLSVVVEYGTKFLNSTQNKYQVEAILKGPLGEEKVFASYLCGCDGSDSLIRQKLGIKFIGKNLPQVFFVADVVAVGMMAEKAVQINMSRKDFTVVMPIQKTKSIRLAGIVPLESENKENISFKNISDYVNKSTNLHVKKVNWFSTYKANPQVASHFGQGRTFLVGDAAHIHNPLSGQGMNTGIGDAVNLAWKLAAVLSGQATSNILTTYESERRSFAETQLSSSDTALRIITSRSILGTIFRGFIFPVFLFFIIRSKPLLRFFFSLFSQTRIHYHSSALSQGSAGYARSGDRLPWLKTKNFNNYEGLKSLDWQIHVYGKANKIFSAVAAFRGFQIFEFEWNNLVQNKGFIKDAFYLIRPDGYISLTHYKQDAEILKKYLNEWGLDHSKIIKSQINTNENNLNI